MHILAMHVFILVSNISIKSVCYKNIVWLVWFFIGFKSIISEHVYVKIYFGIKSLFYVYLCIIIIYWLFPNPFWCMTKRGRSIDDFIFWFHILYIVYLIHVYVGFMFYTYSYMYMFSCFILNKIEYHLRGSFHLSFIFC